MSAEALEQKCRRSRCRSCGGSELLPVLDLGPMPLTSAFVTPDRLNQPEPRYPLEVGWCGRCCLMQVLEAVPTKVIFHDDYPYYSSFSSQMQTHARALARYLIDSKHLGGSSLVVELASNDGYLLRYFAEAGIPVLGIDPARGPAGVARAAGIETHAEFFSSAMAGDLARSGKRADVVLGLNVLAHVEDVNDFVSGISLILKDDGMVVIEVPYVRDLIDRGAFDTIYHEHLHYFSVTSLDALFRRHGLYLNSVERIPIHGGSLRLVVSRLRDAQDSVRLSICEEQKTGLLDFKYYTDFARRAAGVADVLRGMVAQLTEQGQTIAAYGAAAKGVILLNYAGIDHKTIQFVADRNHHKHGRYMPGLKIPVCGPDFLLSRAPDVALLLAWNFAEEVLEQQKQFRDQGGRFLIPNPSPRLV